MSTGKTTKHAASVPFRTADYLQAEDIPGFLAEVMHDGDTCALPLALRTAADVLGMAELARRTGLNRETLYRTLSESSTKVGPGYRVYCGQDGATLVLLLCAGDKRTQTRDIRRAYEYWKDYKARR